MRTDDHNPLVYSAAFDLGLALVSRKCADARHVSGDRPLGRFMVDPGCLSLALAQVVEQNRKAQLRGMFEVVIERLSRVD